MWNVSGMVSRSDVSSTIILLYLSTSHNYYEKGFVSVLGTLHHRVFVLEKNKLWLDVTKLSVPYGPLSSVSEL